MPITPSRIDAEREGARTAARAMDGLRDEATVLAEQMGALGSAVSPDPWCCASADASRGHVAELGQSAASLARGNDDVAVALRGHAQAAVGVVGLAPLLAGVVVGGVVAAGVGYAVQEYGDDVAEAAGDALGAAGDALSGVKDGIKGLFS